MALLLCINRAHGMGESISKPLQENLSYNLSFGTDFVLGRKSLFWD